MIINRITKQGISVSEYIGIHYWLKKEYGIANKCEGNFCKGVSSRFEWALIKDKLYEKKRDNFIQLCRSCHASYDQSEEGIKRMSESKKGKQVYTSKYRTCLTCKVELPAPRLSATRLCEKCSILNVEKSRVKWDKKNLGYYTWWNRKKFKIKPENYRV